MSSYSKYHVITKKQYADGVGTDGYSVSSADGFEGIWKPEGWRVVSTHKTRKIADREASRLFSQSKRRERGKRLAHMLQVAMAYEAMLTQESPDREVIEAKAGDDWNCKIPEPVEINEQVRKLEDFRKFMDSVESLMDGEGLSEQSNYTMGIGAIRLAEQALQQRVNKHIALHGMKHLNEIIEALEQATEYVDAHLSALHHREWMQIPEFQSLGERVEELEKFVNDLNAIPKIQGMIKQNRCQSSSD